MIIDGREIANGIKANIKETCEQMRKKPHVKAVLLGDHPSSLSYLKMLQKSCEQVGFEYSLEKLSSDTSQEELLALIHELNQDESVDGLLVQTPLPKHIQEKIILESIASEKDVDGFNPINAGKLFKGESSMVPCTAKAVMVILESLNMDLAGKEVVVIGRSNIVGKPLSIMLTHAHATVTLCHSQTRDLKFHTKRADIVVVAIGKPCFLKKDMVTEKTIVIDVGINGTEHGIVGDADFDALKDYVQMITPVPGGVGPVTNAVLLEGILKYGKGR